MQEELDNAIATIRLMVDIAKMNHAENRRLKVVIAIGNINTAICTKIITDNRHIAQND